MAKKNLKHALRAHEAKKLQASKVKSIEEAAKRKAISIRTGKQPKSKRKGEQAAKSLTNPFRKEDTILLVGEGNFSFALSLLLPPHSHSPDLILATALDSEEQCYEKYPDAREHVKEMRRIANRDTIVAFQVDAGNLEECKSVMLNSAIKGQENLARWSKVVFNFPHIGAGHKDESRNVLANQLMIVRFLVSVAPFLSIGEVPRYASNGKGGKKRPVEKDEDEDDDGIADQGTSDVEEVDVDHTPPKAGFTVPSYAGSILITLRNCKPYTLWDVPMIAKRLPSVYGAIVSSAPSMSKGVKGPSADQVNRLISIGNGKPYRVWRSFQFHPEHWSKYAHRRTIGWKQGRSTSENEDISRVPVGGEKIENRTWELALAG